MEGLPCQSVIEEEEDGLRIDQILTARYHPLYSRTYFQRLIEEGAVLLNGRPIKKRERPKRGDEIDLAFLVMPEIQLVPENIPLEILYEDAYLLAINKPPGLVVHPAPGHPSGTVVNAILYYCREALPVQDEPLRPGIVHRLDKDTSGILLVAKTAAAQKGLFELFAARKIRKTYAGICLGNPGTKRVEEAIGRHPTHRQKMAVMSEQGKEAFSNIQSVASDGKRSLLMIQPETGRTHQIRVHCQHLRTPLLGDPIYGNLSINEQWKIPRLMLHARSLSFAHPIHQRSLEIKAPFPDDMWTLVTQWFPNYASAYSESESRTGDF